MENGISPISSGYNANQTEGKHKSNLGKDDFMHLMLAQLKYQDPMNPMDSDEYAAQLAQFTQLEQLQNMNSKLEQSISANLALTESVNNTMAANFIGKDIKLSGDEIRYEGQDSVDIGYNLGGLAKDVQVTIFDQYGKEVKSFQFGEQSVGNHKLNWDFTDNDGNNVELDSYTFEVKAKALNGEDLATDKYLLGAISSLKFTESGTKVVVNNQEYSLSDVIEIMNSQQSGEEENG